MDILRAQQILREVSRRQTSKAKLPSLRDNLFSKQQEVLDDPSDLIAFDAGRRSGKTHTAAVWAYVEAAKYPHSWVPILETTSTCIAAQVMWGLLVRLNNEFQLGARTNQLEKTITLTNGTKIQIVGVDQARLADRLRGAPFSGVIIDESGNFRPSVLEYLYIQAIEPSLLDNQGRVFMIGTPSIVAVGPFYRACNGEPGWSHHHWTCFDNPHLPHAAEWLRKLRERRGWSEEHPIYQREWLGLWVHDPSSVVYRFDTKRNLVLPGEALEKPQHVIGVDLGYEDSTAFCVVAYDRAGNVHCIESWKKQHMIPSTVAVETEKLMKKHDVDRIVVDTGGLGKGYAEEMKQRYGLPIIAAKKTEKFAYIELLNGDLRSGRLKLVGDKNQDLIDEMGLLQWEDRDRQKVSDKYEDHLCDALLYSWRYCYNATMNWELEAPKPGTKEWHKQYEDEMWKEPEEETWWQH